MVSVHWQATPGISHTALFFPKGRAVWANVVTYDGPDSEPCREVSGDLDTMIKMLARPRYGFRVEFLHDLNLTRMNAQSQEDCAVLYAMTGVPI